jgi:coenzyme PQQ precursor peptide PqqA
MGERAEGAFTVRWYRRPLGADLAAIMKIMSSGSWRRRWSQARRPISIQTGIRSRGRHPAATSTCRRLNMIWTIPAAADFRFGFEITMYVAAR